MPKRNLPAFTLIELLVVIAIVGVLATFSAFNIVRARVLAQESHAIAELRQLRTAIALLESDTGRWPNGCPPEVVDNPEVDMNNAQAGITVRPSAGSQGGNCVWTQEEADKWNGPYMQTVLDPWDNSYYFDPDYTPYQNCAAKTAQQTMPFIVSFGPNGQGVDAYDCDDIFWALP